MDTYSFSVAGKPYRCYLQSTLSSYSVLSTINTAASLGNNVGVDEFDDEMVQHLLQISDVYEVMGEGGEDELYTEGGRVRGD